MHARHLALCVGLLALCVGGDDSVDSCLIAYSDYKCDGEGVMQGTVKTPRGVSYGYKTGSCNAGDAGAVADRKNGKCENEDDVCKGVPSTCGEDNCLSSQCVLHSWCWRHEPSCSRNFTLHAQYDHTNLNSLSTAATICSHFGDAGNGWRLPSIGSVAFVSNNLTLAASRIANTSSLLFLIDAIRDNQAGTWHSQNGTQVDFNSTDWAPGHPVGGSTNVGLQYVNGTLRLVSVDLSAVNGNVSVLCDVRNRTIPLPTPAPTEPADGVCLTLAPEEGVHLKACEEDGCNDEYRTKDEAVKKCCAYGPVCLGVIETVVPTFLLGIDNLTDTTPGGYTHRRTPGSYITPAPLPVYNGINPGLVGMLALMVFLTFYCAIGMALKVQQGETSFPEVLPNYVFWGWLFGECGACCANICQIVANARPGYGSLPADDVDMEDNDPMPET